MPPVIAYGHYPLGLALQGLDPSSPEGQGVRGLLLKHGVPVYLSGHLHGTLGQRTHHLHPNPLGGVFLSAALQHDTDATPPLPCLAC